MGKIKWGGSRGRTKKRLFMTGYQNSGTGQNRLFWFSHSVSHTLAHQPTISRICCARWTQLSHGCGVMFTFTAPSRAGNSRGIGSWHLFIASVVQRSRAKAVLQLWIIPVGWETRMTSSLLLRLSRKVSCQMKETRRRLCESHTVVRLRWSRSAL